MSFEHHKPGHHRVPPDWNSEVYCAQVEQRLKHLEDSGKRVVRFGWGIAATIIGGGMLYLLTHVVMKGI